MAKSNRGKSKKVVPHPPVWEGDGWVVVQGALKPSRGRPQKTGRLFQHIAEKLPFDSLARVRRWMGENASHLEGVYLAHDSMGAARYGGRGQIFVRLAAHKKKYPRELTYFSFYVIKAKSHEREIETAILRAAGSQMILNQRKVRSGIEPGNISDYEPGTEFFERQRKRGRKAARRKIARASFASTLRWVTSVTRRLTFISLAIRYLDGNREHKPQGFASFL